MSRLTLRDLADLGYEVQEMRAVLSEPGLGCCRRGVEIGQALLEGRVKAEDERRLFDEVMDCPCGAYHDGTHK